MVIQLWYETSQSTNQSSAGTWSEAANVLITSPVVFGDFPMDQKSREGCDFLLAKGSLQKQCLEMGLLCLSPESCLSA